MNVFGNEAWWKIVREWMEQKPNLLSRLQVLVKMKTVFFVPDVISSTTTIPRCGNHDSNHHLRFLSKLFPP